MGSNDPQPKGKQLGSPSSNKTKSLKRWDFDASPKTLSSDMNALISRSKITKVSGNTIVTMILVTIIKKIIFNALLVILEPIALTAIAMMKPKYKVR